MWQFRILIRKFKRRTGFAFVMLLCQLCLTACSTDALPTSEVPDPVAQISEPELASDAESEPVICFPEGMLSPFTDQPKWLYAGENIEMRAFSHMDAPVVRTISNHVVRVLASAWWTEPWVLIYSPSQGQAPGSLGWVLTDTLCEYVSAAEQTVTYPAQLREGAIDLDTGEPVVMRGGVFPSGNVWVELQDDGTALVTCEGGNRWSVALSDVLFPTLVDGELCFEDSLVLEE